MDDIISFLQQLDAVVTLRPGPGDGPPEIGWGDVFFYYSPDGSVPTATQPFATIVTKDYPGFDETSQLDRPGMFRVNVAAGRDAFVRWTGHAPRGPAPANPSLIATDPSTADTVVAHPVYGAQGWLCVVNPGSQTDATVHELLRTAHDLARERHRRHAR